MPSIVYNAEHSGFDLSQEGWDYFYQLLGKEDEGHITPEKDDIDEYTSIYRTHPALVKTVSDLGEKANGLYCRLDVRTYPDYIPAEFLSLREYDGKETPFVDWGRIFVEKLKGGHSLSDKEIAEIVRPILVIKQRFMSN